MAFHYNVGPRTGGGLTTFPNSQETVTEAAFIANIAQLCDQPVPVAANIIRTTLESFIDLARDTKRVEPLFGLFSMRPTSGGHEETDAFTGTLDNINAGLTLVLGKEGNYRFAHNFTSVLDGKSGLRTAIVTRVTNRYNNSPDNYTPQKGLLLEGSDLPTDLGTPAVGVFFQAVATGVEVRVANGDYLMTEPRRMLDLPPAGLTGNQHLVGKARFGQSVRAYTYVTILAQAPL